MEKEFEEALKEMIAYQLKKLYQCALRLNPNVTAEDLLQPMDYPELENNPHFRYEEGLLHGLQMIQMKFQEIFRSKEEMS